MPTIPSARELTNAALGKKLSPRAQAVIDDICSGFPADPPDACDNGNSDPTHAIPNNREERPEPHDGETDDSITRKVPLAQLIEEKLAEAILKEASEPKPTRRTETRRAEGSVAREGINKRCESNRKNSESSTGPRTGEGKAKVSANALKTGFFASVDRLNPQDSPAYLDAVEDMRMGLHPDGPVEEQLIRELAMFRARLMRLESAEYALICSGIETDPGDARQIAVSFTNNTAALEHMHKAEVHLRRAYNRTWDRLERMQKERLKMPFNESIKQSQRWATYEAQRTSCPKCAAADTTPGKEEWKKLVPQLHPDFDENGNPKKYPAGHPLYRPNDDNSDDTVA